MKPEKSALAEKAAYYCVLSSKSAFVAKFPQAMREDDKKCYDNGLKREREERARERERI
jgi:hypothetical protein